MPKTVDVFSRNNIINQTPRPDACLISIWSLSAIASEGYEDNVPMQGWKDTLRLDFDDVTHDNSGIFFPFSEEQAKLTDDFIHKNDGYDFVIHCDAGYSRSVAVGSYISNFYDYEPIYHEIGHDGFKNMHVYLTLAKLFINKIWDMEDGTDKHDTG